MAIWDNATQIDKNHKKKIGPQKPKFLGSRTVCWNHLDNYLRKEIKLNSYGLVHLVTSQLID